MSGQPAAGVFSGVAAPLDDAELEEELLADAELLLLLLPLLELLLLLLLEEDEDEEEALAPATANWALVLMIPVVAAVTTLERRTCKCMKGCQLQCLAMGRSQLRLAKKAGQVS